jgi:hypothetical protein
VSSVCARSGAAVLYLALHSPIVRGHLFDMQGDMDKIAAGPSTAHHRTHQAHVDRAWAAHARRLKARAAP